jgi:hypothetical protein
MSDKPRDRAIEQRVIRTGKRWNDDARSLCIDDDDAVFCAKIVEHCSRVVDRVCCVSIDDERNAARLANRRFRRGKRIMWRKNIDTDQDFAAPAWNQIVARSQDD